MVFCTECGQLLKTSIKGKLIAIASATTTIITGLAMYMYPTQHYDLMALVFMLQVGQFTATTLKLLTQKSENQ